MAAENGSSKRSGDGIYAYETKAGTLYYFKYRKSDGRSATKRGFTSTRAARIEASGGEGLGQLGEIAKLLLAATIVMPFASSITCA